MKRKFKGNSKLPCLKRKKIPVTSFNGLPPEIICKILKFYPLSVLPLRLVSNDINNNISNTETKGDNTHSLSINLNSKKISRLIETDIPFFKKSNIAFKFASGTEKELIKFMDIFAGRFINLTNCNRCIVTHRVLTHFKGIHTLNMRRIKHITITDASFKHLKGIHTLNMAYNNSYNITDDAFFLFEGYSYANYVGM